MKKLIDLLRENLEEETMEVKEAITKNYDVVDEVGKFFVVTKPDTKSNKEKIMFEADAFKFADKIKGGLKFENVLGMYKNKAEANKAAAVALKERDTQIEELKTSMNDFRTTRDDIKTKKEKAQELIKKLQQ
jgi:hypothetical protein